MEEENKTVEPADNGKFVDWEMMFPCADNKVLCVLRYDADSEKVKFMLLDNNDGEYLFPTGGEMHADAFAGLLGSLSGYRPTNFEAVDNGDGKVSFIEKGSP